MLGDAYLTGQDDLAAYLATAGDARLRGYYRVLSDFRVVADLHQVVDLDPGAYPRGAQGPAIDGGSAADFDVVADLDAAYLWKFPLLAIPEDIAEAVAAYHDARIYDDARANPYARIKSYTRIKMAVLTDTGSGPNETVRIDLGVRRDHSAIFDNGKWADCHSFADFR